MKKNLLLKLAWLLIFTICTMMVYAQKNENDTFVTQSTLVSKKPAKYKSVGRFKSNLVSSIKNTLTEHSKKNNNSIVRLKLSPYRSDDSIKETYQQQAIAKPKTKNFIIAPNLNNGMKKNK